MARVAVLSGTAILDTSWLLELYRVPGYFKESRTDQVRADTTDLIEAKCELFGRVGGVVTEPLPPQTRACAIDALGSSPDRFAQERSPCAWVRD